MRVFITGGAGFIGSHLVAALLDQGDDVIVFDCSPDPVLLRPCLSRITYMQGDAGVEADFPLEIALEDYLWSFS